MIIAYFDVKILTDRAKLSCMLNNLNSLVNIASGSLTEKFVDFAVKLINQIGEPGVALIILIENLFPPIPSEAILPLAGFGASKGELSLVLAIGWATIGSVVGAIMLYWAGAWLGRERARDWAKKIPLMKVKDIDKTEKWFIKHESKAVFWGRMLPIFRSLISIPAGIEKMPMSKFIPYTAAGSLIWNSVLILAGYGLGEKFNKVETYAGVLQNAVIILILAGLGYFVYSRTKKRKIRKKV
jgi:membrane protein DedA with SNARE-associated domain